MSSSHSRPTSRPPSHLSSQTTSPKPEIEINGVKYRLAYTHVVYDVSKHHSSKQESLVDRGANGGIAGADVRVISKSPDRVVNIQGIDNHEITDIPIVTAGGVAQSQHGEIIVILNQYAYHGKGKSIHSCVQLKAFETDVNYHSVKVAGGK